MIDATAITRNKAGVGVYAKNLIDSLIAECGDLRLYVLAQSDDPDLDYSGHANVTVVKVPAKLFRKLPFRFLLEQLGIPILLLRYHIQVLHSLHYSFPLFCFGAKRVVTLHDMTFFDMPEMHEPFKVFYFQFFIRQAVRRAEAVIFVSRSAQRDCARRLGPTRGLSLVIHHGKSAAFRHDLDAATVERVRKKYNLPAEYALYIGTIEPRKNLTRLVDAFASISANHPDLALVIAGKKGWMCEDLFASVDKLGVSSRIIFAGFIEEQDKPFMLAAAKIFVYPSLYEGFGLPVLEALACGTPTVTSNSSSLPEVAGDAALLVDPKSEESISTAMQCLLSDSSLREQLSLASTRQAARFTWSETAASTAATYCRVAELRSSPVR